MEIFGGEHTHNWWITAAQYSHVLSDLRGAGHWYGGNWEFVGQLFGGEQFYPSHAYFVGVTPILRYDFAAGHRLVPFVDAGAGLTATDIRDGELSTTFEFNLQIGAGIHWFVADDVALTFQYRFIHLSNAGIEYPNNGVNNNTILLGVTAFF
jgi:opacity protein-like surface antigen